MQGFTAEDAQGAEKIKILTLMTLMRTGQR
jgi:hypothetical protein